MTFFLCLLDRTPTPTTVDHRRWRPTARTGFTRTLQGLSGAYKERSFLVSDANESRDPTLLLQGSGPGLCHTARLKTGLQSQITEGQIHIQAAALFYCQSEIRSFYFAILLATCIVYRDMTCPHPNFYLEHMNVCQDRTGML